MAAEAQSHDVVVIGASAGGLEPLCRIAGQLPADLPAAVFVVLHVSAGFNSLLPAILSRHGRLPAVHPASEGEPIQRGRIYVAPPDRHLLVEQDRVVLSKGPRENRVRPSIDVLFRSAAVAYGPRVIGVVLSGSLDDGASGLVTIKRQGGLVLVQDPNEAQAPGMPRAALQVIEPDNLIRAGEAGEAIDRLVRTPVSPPMVTAPARTMAEVVTSATGDPEAGEMSLEAAERTPFSCPECGGALFELKDGRLHRFRCYLGHAYNPLSLLDAQNEELEQSLWAALRVLEERAKLLQRLSEQAVERGDVRSAASFADQAGDLRRHADRLREVVR
jgi:two-component system chemotaxis response regulator CheB